MSKIRGFLRVVHYHARRVLDESDKPNQPVTYEDLYHLCAQVVTDTSGGATRYTDPFNLAIRPFSEKLRRDAKPFLLEDPEPHILDGSKPLLSTAEEGCWLITGVVRGMLNSDNVDDDSALKESFLPLLEAVNEAKCRQKDVKQVTIVTLNHDVLVETLLEKHCDLTPGIGFKDGFGPLEEGTRRYKPDRLFDDSAKVRVIKPHGSINWYSDEDGPIALPVTHRVSNRLRPRRFEKSEPSFLSGIGKEGRYQYGIFGDMVEAFQHVFRQTTNAIESGFGWQDEGMHNLLSRYLYRRKENQLLRLHPKKDPEDPASEIKLPSHAYLKSLRVNSKGGLTPEGLIDGPNYMSHEDASWTKIKEVLGLP